MLPNLFRERADLNRDSADLWQRNNHLAEIREMNTLLRNVSNNINQIAARANATGNVYAADIVEIQARQDELWEQQNRIIGAVTKMTEGR
jgi:hypothetical protein